MKKNGAPGPSVLQNAFETIPFLTRSLLASQTLACHKLYNDVNTKYWIIETNESKVLDDLANSLPTLELLEKQKYIRFCQLILATKNSDPNSGFQKSHNGFSLRRHPSISGLQQILTSHSLQEKLSIIAQDYKPAPVPGVTWMCATLQRIYYWPQMAADVIFDIRDYMHCKKKIWLVCAKKLAPYSYSHCLNLLNALLSIF